MKRHHLENSEGKQQEQPPAEEQVVEEQEEHQHQQHQQHQPSEEEPEASAITPETPTTHGRAQMSLVALQEPVVIVTTEPPTDEEIVTATKEIMQNEHKTKPPFGTILELVYDRLNLTAFIVNDSFSNLQEYDRMFTKVDVQNCGQTQSPHSSSHKQV
jgi:hypothetical protein